VFCSASSRTLFHALLLVSLSCAAIAENTLPANPTAPSQIVIGFVGGFVRHNNPHQQPVKLAQRIRENAPPETYVEVFENRRRKQAYKTVLRLLDSNHDGVLSVEEKSHARIVLFGHSWGAAAAVLLARELERSDIPVLLTVQVDSVAKLWQNDSVIPDNVGQAVNFYQPHGLVHGQQKISAENPAKTQVIGNFLIDYNKIALHCSGLSWFDRYLTPSHAKSQCDAHLWSQIEDMVRQRLTTQSPAENAVAIPDSGAPIARKQ